jgi:hypothetical protein
VDPQHGRRIAKRIVLGIVAGFFALVLIGMIVPHKQQPPMESQVVSSSQPAVPVSAVSPAPLPPSRQAPLDAGAWLACRTWAPIAKDANDGVLSQSEFREGVKRVYDHAKAWPDSDVTRTSRSLLAALTTVVSGLSQQEADEQLRTEFLALVRACDGWEDRK